MDASTSRAESAPVFSGWADALPEPLLLVNDQGVILDANRAAARLGDGDTVLSGLALSEVVADSTEEIQRLLHRWRRNGEPVPGSLRWRTSGGRIKPVRCDGSRVRDGVVLLRCAPRAETSSRFIVLDRKIEELGHEILERRRSEELVRAQNKVLELVAASAPLSSILNKLALMVEEHSGTGVYASILLLDEDGMHLRHAAAPRLPMEYTAVIDGVAIGPVVGSCGTAAYRKEPVIVSDIATDPLWAEYRDAALAHGLAACWSTPILTVDGRVLGTFALYYTHSHEPEPREQQLVQIITRTAAIAIERKRSEQERERQTLALARTNAELERFAYVASHDLQEPLRTIASYTQLLARRYKGRIDSDADEFIEFIVRGVRRMSDLLHDLLSYTRLIHPKSLPAKRAVSSSSAVEAAIDNLAAMVQESGASVMYGQLPIVFADPVQLTQIFQNLISNAIKYRKEEPPRVEIRCEERDGEFLFSVSDNGIGIDAVHWQEIFVPLKRLQSGRVEGTGMGLAICAKIAESHGGRIWVSSRPGEGSTFRFTLPRR